MAGARRGWRSDAAALIRVLESHELIWPLRRAVAAIADIVPADVFYAEKEGGERLLTFFTNPEIGAKAIACFGWDEDAEPSLLTVRGVDALRGALRVTAADPSDRRRSLLVVDPLAASELELTPFEADRIARGNPVPLARYVVEEETSAHVGANILIGEPAEPPPSRFVELVEAYAETASTSSFRIVQVFDPERDVEPHLHVDFERDGATPVGAYDELLERLNELAPGATVSENLSL
jgi:hypothetical protein